MEYRGSKFYHDVWKNWKTISSVNNLNVWKQLEEGLDEFVKEKNLDVLHIAKPNGIIPTISKIDLLVTIKREVYQPTVFSLDGEEHFEPDKPWKKKWSLLHSSDGEESKVSSTHKKQGGQGLFLG
jgi:hypothetical protein